MNPCWLLTRSTSSRNDLMLCCILGWGFQFGFFLSFSSIKRLFPRACWPHVLNKYLAHPSIYQYGSYGVFAGGLSVLVFTGCLYVAQIPIIIESNVIMQRRLEEAVTFKNHVTASKVM